jgi:hypothetical protein
MGLVLIVLILLLALASYLLYSLSMVKPRKSDAGSTTKSGMTWVRSIYGTSNKVVDFFGQTGKCPALPFSAKIRR